MKIILFSFIWSAALPAFGGPKDFFVFRGEAAKEKTHFAVPMEDCREHIAKVVCLVDAAKPGAKPADRPCLEGGADYAGFFEKLYDNYPPAMQKMFCSLDYLFIEKTFVGTAYAGTILDPAGNPMGAVMGIRKSVLDEALNLSTWASWKEQLSFGGIKDNYTLTPSLPQITSISASGVSDFLYFVVAHEFGHIFDFANKLNFTSTCKPKSPDTEDPECDMADGSWGAMTWSTNFTPKPQFDYAHRKQLCFYWCNEALITAAETPELFAGLQGSPFLSTYASSNPWDDFADSLAYYLMDQNLNTTYVIDTKHGATLDIMAKMRSPVFAPKYQYIQNFLSRTDIIYP